MQHHPFDYRTSSFHFACDLYNLLPNPAILPCGKPNIWLLEMGVGPSNHHPSIPSPKPEAGKEYTAYAELTLWDAKTNQSAATHYTHTIRGYGGMSLTQPVASTSAKDYASREATYKNKTYPQATDYLDLGFTVITAIVSTFADSSIPGYFTRPPGTHPPAIGETSTSSHRHSPVAPHAILVHDRSLASLLTYLFSTEGVISSSIITSPPLFSFIPLPKTKKQKYLLLPDGTNSQIPVICAQCKMLGVSNTGKLDGELEKLVRCSACSTAWYCSKECQRVDWANGHKWDCAEGKGKQVKVR